MDKEIIARIAFGESFDNAFQSAMMSKHYIKTHKKFQEIYLTGSRKSIERTVYTDTKSFFVKWNGQFIKVAETSSNKWRTVENY